MEQRSKQWFEDRKGRVTGSAVGAILNLNPWTGRADVMRRMVREYHDLPSEFQGNAATQWGTLNEETALGALEITLDREIKPAYFVKFEDWLGASPDGYLDDDELVEIKCPYSLRNSEKPVFKSIEEQPYYYAQVQIQLFVTDRRGCYFYQFAPSGDKTEYIEYDSLWINENLPKLKEFYQEYLEEIRPENAWKYIDGGNIAKRYKMAIAGLEAAKAEMEEAKKDLIDATGGKGGQVGDLKITKVSKKGSVAYSKVVNEMLPDIDLEQYRGKPSEYWKIS